MALEIGIGANNDELKSKLAESQLLLENLKKQKAANIKVGLDVTNLQKQINDTKASISSLSAEINKNSSALDGNSRATANGSNTLTQFSRIAQDAPFGIIGIGNNLTATAESFAHLSQSAGGAGGALKAVASSLMGTGGILLAVSLVTTGLTIMAQKGLTISDVFSMLSGNFNQAANDIKKAYEESSKSALGEVASIKAVIAIAKDENASRAERLAAVEELQKKYPAYFGNLSAEEIMYGNLSKQIKSVGQALIAKAVAEKIADKAGDAMFKQLQLNAKLIEAKEKLATAEKEYQIIKEQGYSTGLDAAGKNLVKQGLIVKQVRAEWLKVNNQINQYQKTIDAATKIDITENVAEDAVNKRLEEEKAAEKARQKSAADAAARTLAEQKRIEAERLKSIKEFHKNADEISQGVYDIEAAQVRRGEEAKYKEMLKGQELQKKLAEERTRIALDGAAAEERARMKTIEGLKSDLAAELLVLKSYLDSKAITQEQYDIMAQEQRLKSLEAQRALVPEHQIISDAIVGTIQNMGTALGQALATGADIAKSMGNALLAGLGGLLAAMGDHLIKIGTAAVLASKVMKVFGTVAGLGAGLAAIAGGVLLKGIGGVIASKANNRSNSASNGMQTQPGQRGAVSTGADISSPTSSVSSGGTFNNTGGTVVFEIAGQKLIGVLNNTLNGNARLGGAGLVG